MSENKSLEVHGLGSLSINSLPMLKISQSQTKGVADGTMKPGEIFNSVTEESFGATVELVAYFRYDRRTKFPKRGEGTNIECFSPDLKHGINGRICDTCPKKRNPNNYMDDDLCTDQSVFIVAPAADPDNWMLMPFMRSSFATGKKLRKILQVACTQHNIPIYGQKFVMKKEKVDHKKSGSTYFIMDTELSERVSDEDMLKKLAQNQATIEAKLQEELMDFLASVPEDAYESVTPDAPVPTVSMGAEIAATKDQGAIL